MPAGGDPAKYSAIGRHGQHSSSVGSPAPSACRAAMRQYKSGETVGQRGLADPARTGHQHRMRHAAGLKETPQSALGGFVAEQVRVGARRRRARSAVASRRQRAGPRAAAVPPRPRRDRRSRYRRAASISTQRSGILGGDRPKSGAQPLVKCTVEPLEAVGARRRAVPRAPAPRRPGDRGSTSDPAGNRRPQDDAPPSTRRARTPRP